MQKRMDYSRRKRKKSIIVGYIWTCGDTMASFIKRHPWSLHVFLIMIVICYASVGGLFFTLFEGATRQQTIERRLHVITQCVSNTINKTMNKTKAVDVTVVQLEETTQKIMNQCFKKSLERDILPWNYEMSTLYSFTVMTTVGYGRMAPETEGGRMFCICFAIIGIPLTMIIIANFGKFLSTAVCSSLQKWKDRRKRKKKRKKKRHNEEHGKSSLEENKEEGEDEEEEQVQPTGLMILLGFFGYVLAGGVMMQMIEGENLTFINGLFYIFMWITAIDVASIGTGSLIFLPLKLLYAAIGLALATIAIEIGSKFLQKIHWFGRKPKHLENVKIWFGGQQVTVRNLTRSIGRKVGLDPDTLGDMLDMDKVVETAVAEEQGEEIPEEDEPLFVMVKDKSFVGSFSPDADGFTNIEDDSVPLEPTPKAPFSSNRLAEYLNMPSPRRPVWQDYVKAPPKDDTPPPSTPSPEAPPSPEPPPKTPTPEPRTPTPEPVREPTPPPPRTPTPEPKAPTPEPVKPPTPEPPRRTPTPEPEKPPTPEPEPEEEEEEEEYDDDAEPSNADKEIWIFEEQHKIALTTPSPKETRPPIVKRKKQPATVRRGNPEELFQVYQQEWARIERLTRKKVNKTSPTEE